ncbi:MAG: c-type cytochrome [Candidatus Omnitrophica bacterium]|nr:c-type cytochrome [Candidatus Omnitrophota bacterium]
MRTKALLFIVLVFLSVACFTVFQVTTSAQTQISAGEKPSLTKDLFSKGEVVYQKQCAICHGLQGAGDGLAAYLLYPKARDFTRNEFRLISTTEMIPTDEDLFKTVTRGMPGSAMPSWESLSEIDRWGLVYYVRYLAQLGEAKRRGEIDEQKFKKELPWDIQKKYAVRKIDPASVIHVPPEPQATSESLARGRELFVKACAPCHGLQGKGDGQQIMRDNLGLPLRPRDLTSGIFKGEPTSEALYHRMTAGLPGSPMPSYQAAFNEEQIWDLIHYVKTLPKEGVEERVRLVRREIPAKKVQGALPLDPVAKEWQTTQSTYVALTPLWWRDNRIEGVEIKALYNDKQIAIHLTWKDPTEDKSGTLPQTFSDGAAIEFSSEKDPPFFGMGDSKGIVHIWHWKASWQEDLKQRDDIETRYPNTAIDWYESDKSYKHGAPFETRESKTEFHDPQFVTAWGAGNPLADPTKNSALEEGKAKGLGTFTTYHPKVSSGKAEGVWKDDGWQIVFSRELKADKMEDITFQPGNKVSVAFAIWDGSVGDRDGQKSVSIWNELTLEE